MRISFTGSTTAGKAIMREAAAELKSITLELGGNDPAIVLPDIDPEKVAQCVTLADSPALLLYTHAGLGICSSGRPATAARHASG